MNVYGISFWVMKLFWSYTEEVITQHCQCTNCYWTVHFKMVTWILCKLHQNERKKKTKKWSAFSVASGMFSPQVRNVCVSAHTWKTRLVLLGYCVWLWWYGYFLRNILYKRFPQICYLYINKHRIKKSYI